MTTSLADMKQAATEGQTTPQVENKAALLELVLVEVSDQPVFIPGPQLQYPRELEDSGEVTALVACGETLVVAGSRLGRPCTVWMEVPVWGRGGKAFIGRDFQRICVAVYVACASKHGLGLELDSIEAVLEACYVRRYVTGPAVYFAAAAGVD